MIQRVLSKYRSIAGEIYIRGANAKAFDLILYIKALSTLLFSPCKSL